MIFNVLASYSVHCTNSDPDDLDRCDPNDQNLALQVIADNNLSNEKCGHGSRRSWDAAAHITLCLIVNFASHVIQSRSDSDSFIKRV